MTPELQALVAPVLKHLQDVGCSVWGSSGVESYSLEVSAVEVEDGVVIFKMCVYIGYRVGQITNRYPIGMNWLKSQTSLFIAQRLLELVHRDTLEQQEHLQASLNDMRKFKQEIERSVAAQKQISEALADGG